MAQGTHDELLAHVTAAYTRRAALHDDPDNTAYRLFHGHGEGVPGLTIDRFGDAIVITHSAEHSDAVERVAECLTELHPDVRCIVARPHRGADAPRVVRGTVSSEYVVVQDNGLHHEVDLFAGRSHGLYLDARLAREWIRANASERRVLNLFAYTGSLGMAASAGDARWVIHVEMQRRALRRLKRNYKLNRLRIDDRDLVRADLYPHLRRLANAGREFDGIILDPPPMVPGREVRGQDYADLVRLATEVLAPDGWLLCFFSSYRRTRDAYEEEVLGASPGTLDVLWRGTSGIDFPETDADAKLRFAAFRRSG